MHARFFAFALAAPLLTALLAWFWPAAIWLLALILPLIGVGLYDMLQ